MKAVAVKPGEENSLHLREVDKPKLEDIKNGRGVLVKVLKVALDGTDKDINQGSYGESPEKDDFLIIGHEAFGVVEDIGEKVTEVKRGDYVIPMVRRPGKTIYDKIGMSDMTTQDEVFERGISKLHGFLTEYFVDTPDFLIKVNESYKENGVLAEPISIVEKGWEQITAIQRRMKIWKPERAIVLGLGPLGLLFVWKFRLEGIEVFGFDHSVNEEKKKLVESIGVKYFASKEQFILDVVNEHGQADIVVEATGVAENVPHTAQSVAKNGVLLLTSVTPKEENIELPIAEINQEFVLGNKLMVGTVNANEEHFKMAIQDIGFSETRFPGFLQKLITHRFNKLDDIEEAWDKLINSKNAIKVVLEIGQES
jgi:glucose 1-dehydrogenase